MKNKIGLFLMLFGLAICVVAVVFLVNYKKSSNDIKYLDYEVVSNKYSDYQSKIISTYDQYLSDFIGFMEEEKIKYGSKYDFDKNKYSKEYFDTKSLAIINIVTGSGMNKLKNIKVYARKDVLYCNADIKYAEGTVTDDINSTMILVEVDKNITTVNVSK